MRSYFLCNKEGVLHTLACSGQGNPTQPLRFAEKAKHMRKAGRQKAPRYYFAVAFCTPFTATSKLCLHDAFFLTKSSMEWHGLAEAYFSFIGIEVSSLLVTGRLTGTEMMRTE